MKSVKINKILYAYCILTYLCIMAVFGQGTVTTTNISNMNLLPDTFLNRYFAGEGVELHNCKFNWSSGAISGTQVGLFTNPNPYFPFTSGIILATCDIHLAEGPSTSGGSSASENNCIGGIAKDADLQALCSGTLKTTSCLEFTFYNGRGDNNVASFNYIFGSEEYPEYVCSQFNDIFAFFLYGPDPYNNCQAQSTNTPPYNIATIPGSDPILPVTINSLNNGSIGSSAGANPICTSLNYSQFYRNNSQAHGAIEYDGYTARTAPGSNTDIGMTAETPPLCACSEYKMRISIAHAGDKSFESGVFLEQGSFKMPKKLTIGDSITSNRDTLIKNCSDSHIKIKYGEPLDAPMNIVLYSDGGTAQQEDFYVLRYRSDNRIDTVHHGDNIYFPEGDTLIDIKLQVTETAQFAPGEVKSVQLVFKSILCPSFKYLEGPPREMAQYDTLRYLMINNNRFTLVSDTTDKDTLFFCDKCEHVAVPIIGGTEPLIYKWDHPELLDSANSRESDCNITEDTTFRIIVSDRWGCLVDTCYHTIRIASTPVLEGHYHINPRNICVPEEVEFRSTATHANTHEWIIYNDNGADTIYGSPKTYTFTKPGKYSILYHAYEAKECDTSINLINYIHAGMKPTASFYFDPLEAEVGDTVFFTNESTGLNVHYEWSFGDGSNSTNEDPIHVYYSDNSDYYNVILTVSDDADCKDIYTQPVHVVDNHVLFVPNSFTPNNDEHNPVFLPVVACVDPKRYYMVIYDRNGSIVFATNDTKTGWDGTINGKDCPSGIYTYYISYYRYNNMSQELIKTGYINLIR